MKERSFTRCTVLAPTPRALAMASMPLPAVFDSDSFSKVWSICGRPSCCPPQRLIREDLHGRRRRGADSPVGGLIDAWTPCAWIEAGITYNQGLVGIIGFDKLGL
jgi:hypothetical protein